MEIQQSDSIYKLDNILAELLFYKASPRSKEPSEHAKIFAQLYHPLLRKYQYLKSRRNLIVLLQGTFYAPFFKNQAAKPIFIVNNLFYNLLALFFLFNYI